MRADVTGLYTRLGRVFKKEREARKIGLREMARRLQISPNTLCTLEAGTHAASLHNFIFLAQHLELSLDEVIDACR